MERREFIKVVCGVVGAWPLGAEAQQPGESTAHRGTRRGCDGMESVDGCFNRAGYAEPMLEADRVKSMAQASGLEAARIGVWRAEDIAPAFESLTNKADALYVVSDALIAANRTRIVTLALSGRLPTIMSYDDYVAAGGLMSYGPDYPDLFRKAAEMVDKILRGTKPGDIPVEQPTKFEFAINAKTAAALGLTIPQTFLATVDEVLK
jgi:putative ABC transport system substrate-binding protein